MQQSQKPHEATLKRIKVGIIGGGIVGRICALSLKSELFEVTVFDAVHSSKNVRFHADPSSGPAAFPKGARILGTPGGEVLWGRNVCAALFDDTSKWPDLYISKLKSICSKLEEYGFPKITTQYIPQNRNSKMLIKQANPLLQLDIKFKEAIDKKSIVFIDKLVEKISTNGIIPNIHYLDNSGNFHVKQFDHLICALGPIGNFEILQRSGLSLKLPAQIYNHPSISIASAQYKDYRCSGKWIFFPNKWRRKSSMECQIFTDRKNSLTWTLRVFAPDTLGVPGALGKSFSSFIKHPMISFALLGNAIKAIGVGRPLVRKVNIELSIDFRGNQMISIHNEKDSKLEHLVIRNSDSPEIEISEETSSAIIAFLTTLNAKEVELQYYSNGSFRFPLSQFSSSTHLMGLTPVRKTKHGEDNRYDFSLENYPNIYVVGASTFFDSVPGHPTYLAATTAVYVADSLNDRNADH
jgi:hypothetical protein